MQTIPQMQTNNKTFFGRHWPEYQVLQRLVPSGANISILSFGCSTGEEIQTLQLAFPSAKIFGCDIDWNNLRQARALLGPSATIFASSPAELEKNGPYDIIVCNSVLLKHPAFVKGRPAGIDPTLWTDVIHLLDSCLKPGGILQIINSNIPFRFHPLAANYRTLNSKLLSCSHFVNVFDLSGNQLAEGVGGTGWSAVIPRHLMTAHSQSLEPGDVDDIHFWKANGSSPPAEIHDEIMLTLGTDESKPWATGSTTYRPAGDTRGRKSTYLELDTHWVALAVDRVRVKKRARRIWFDGSVKTESETTVDHEGASATALIEMATGRRSTFISMSETMTPNSVLSPQFGIKAR